MANNSDLGVIHTSSGTQITTAYDPSETIDLAACGEARLLLKVALNAASTVTSVTLKCQAIDADDNAYDLISYKLNTNTSQPGLEQAYTSLSGGNTYYFQLKVPDCKLAPGFRVATKASGTGHASDVITVTCFAW